MSWTTAQLVQLAIAHKEAAAACEEAVKDAAAARFRTEGVADTSRIPGVGQIGVALTHDSARIVNQELFLDWLAARFPTEVAYETTTTVRTVHTGGPEPLVTTRVAHSRSVINEAWLKTLLASLLPVDPSHINAGEDTSCMDGEGAIIPGVVWRKGGALHQVSLKPDSGLQRQYREAARAYALDGSAMPAIGAGATPGVAVGV